MCGAAISVEIFMVCEKVQFLGSAAMLQAQVNV